MYKGNYKPRKDRECLYANEDNDSNEQELSASDDEIGFAAIKEESPNKVAFASQVEKKYNWIIDSDFSHHMIGDMNKFLDFKIQDGGIVKVGNNATCQVKGIGSITLDGKTNTEDVYFVDGLKHNILSVGQLVDKGYHLQFIEKTCMTRDKDEKVIRIGTRSRCNVFQLNPTEMTCLVAKIDDNWLWHKRFCHINIDSIVRTSRVFAIRDLSKIVKPTNTICKECVLAKHNRTFFPSKKFCTIVKLEIVHIDLSGAINTKGFYGESYFMILVDDFSRMMWVAFLKEKFEAFDKFKIFKNRVENEFGIKIKCLRSDGGGEFTSNEFNIFCEESRIRKKLPTNS